MSAICIEVREDRIAGFDVIGLIESIKGVIHKRIVGAKIHDMRTIVS